MKRPYEAPKIFEACVLAPGIGVAGFMTIVPQGQAARCYAGANDTATRRESSPELAVMVGVAAEAKASDAPE